MVGRIKCLLFCIVLLLSEICVYSQQDTSLISAKHYNIALGNMDKQRKANINVGLVGDLYNLNGLNFNLVSSWIRQNGKGVNWGGAGAFTQNNMSGMQYASVVNIVGGKMTGLQLSTILNIAKHTKGVQISSFNNMNASALRGFQLCGIENISAGVEKGMQLAGVTNISINNMQGFQFSPFNYADTLNGLQIGLINISTEQQKGVQIGVFNYSRNNTAKKIGLVNLSPLTRIQMMFFGGNASKINLAARFKNNNTYNILGFGTHYMGLDEKFSGSFFYRLGYWKNIFNEKWAIYGDLGFSHIETFQQNDLETPERLYSLNTNLSLEYQRFEHLGFFVGTGYGVDRYYQHNKNYRKSFLLKIGLVLF